VKAAGAADAHPFTAQPPPTTQPPPTPQPPPPTPAEPVQQRGRQRGKSEKARGGRSGTNTEADVVQELSAKLENISLVQEALSHAPAASDAAQKKPRRRNKRGGNAGVCLNRAFIEP